jgi:hypothetical protein
MTSEYNTRVSGGLRQAGNTVALLRALLSVGPTQALLRSCVPTTVARRLAPGAWEIPVTELSPEQAREKCHKSLVAGLRLIRREERVGAIAKALQEIEAREKRRRTAVDRQ